MLDAYDQAGCPPPESFRLDIDRDGQHLRHPRLPTLALPRA
ncbi:hypothetical protein [Peterkaempfera bronchialis]|nr:hypothetical protein [Peterkaempfera bronchialis]